MKYENYIDLDNLTIGDCMWMFTMNNLCIVISDGRVVDLVREKND